MISILDKLYIKLRSKEVQIGIAKLRKIEIDEIYTIINNECWSYDIQYEVICKNSEILIMKIEGIKGEILFFYHKCVRDFREKYLSLISATSDYDYYCCIYITTGIFAKTFFTEGFEHKIKLIDSFHFVKGQIGIFGKARNVFDERKLVFLNYILD